MSESYVWELDQNEKRRMLEAAESHFPSSKKVELLSDTLDVDNKTLYRHKEGEIRGIDLSTAERLINLLNKSEPRYPLEYSERFVEDEYVYGGEEMVSLDPDFQRFVLAPFSNSEIAEKSGKSEATALKYRQAQRKLPKQLYVDTFKHLKEINRTQFEAVGPISPNIPYHSEEDALLQEASEKDVVEFNQGQRDVEMLERTDPRSKGVLASYKEVLDELEAVIRSQHRSGIDTGGHGEVARSLKQLDIVEDWGGHDSTYYPIKRERVAYLEGVKEGLKDHSFYQY